jgi:predicted Zn-dependent protease
MTEGPGGGHDSRPGQIRPASQRSAGTSPAPPEQADAAQDAAARDAAGPPDPDKNTPDGDPQTWYRRGLDLLEKGSPAAAVQLLERAAAAEPDSRMVREALARAQFDAGWYVAAADSFRMIVEASPADDYAHFGLGLALARSGSPGAAAEYLALAAAMRPDLPHYTGALRGVRATLRARDQAQTDAGTGTADT